jgi:hypothetical protein
MWSRLFDRGRAANWLVTTSYVRATDAPPAIRTRIVSESGEQSFQDSLRATGGNREGRITEINDFRIEAIPRGHMLVMHNRDVPGVMGRIGNNLARSRHKQSANFIWADVNGVGKRWP